MKKRRQGKVLLQLNVIALIVSIAFFLYLLVVANMPIYSMYFALSAVAFSFNIWLIITGHNRIAAVFGIVLSNLLVFVFDTGVVDNLNNSAILYIPLLLFTYVVTKYEQRGERWLLISFSIISLLIVNFTDWSPKLGTAFIVGGNVLPIRAFNDIVAIITSLLIISTVSRYNYYTEEELIEAKELAEKSLKEKTRFLSIMSHEIRTPANAVVGMTNILMSKAVPEDVKRDIRVLSYSAQNMKAIIDNIIYYNKLELGKEDIVNQPFDIRKFCHSIIDSFEHEAGKKNLKLSFDFDDRIPQFLIGDSDKLGQVITNLLSNAIKFTRSGDIFLWVKMNHVDENNCYVMFKLADTGIGIDEEKMKVVFNEFSQLDSNITRNYDGMGLGLSISKKLLALLGSQIRVVSEPGVGTTFDFDLPLGLTNEVKGTEQRYIEAHDLKKCRILLVEDNKLNILVAKKILTGMNALVDVAKNGEEGAKMAEANTYDIILMDIHMPVMDGYEATRKIRETNATIPVLAFTADAFDEARIKAKEVGMNDFISKPFDPVVLYEKIIANRTDN